MRKWRCAGAPGDDHRFSVPRDTWRSSLSIKYLAPPRRVSRATLKVLSCQAYYVHPPGTRMRRWVAIVQAALIMLVVLGGQLQWKIVGSKSLPLLFSFLVDCLLILPLSYVMLSIVANKLWSPHHNTTLTPCFLCVNIRRLYSVAIVKV